jgi:hypothetical protein
MSAYLSADAIKNLAPSECLRFPGEGKSGLEAASALMRMLLLDSIARTEDGGVRTLFLDAKESDYESVKSGWVRFVRAVPGLCLVIAQGGLGLVEADSGPAKKSLASIGNNFLTKLPRGKDGPRPRQFWSCSSVGTRAELTLRPDSYREAVGEISRRTSPGFPRAVMALLCASCPLEGETAKEGVAAWIRTNFSNALADVLVANLECEPLSAGVASALRSSLCPAEAVLGIKDFGGATVFGSDDLLGALNEELAIVLYGPPGSGKSYLARDLAERFTGSKDRVSAWQFHPGTSYDDFVGGLVCSGPGLFTPAPGFFRETCERAMKDPSSRYCVVIDELNRANVVAVFGEYLTLLERSRRGEALSCRVAGQSQSIMVPKNVGLVCTMNTADRTLDAIDVAARRRMRFLRIDSSRTAPYFEALTDAGMAEADASDLIDLITSLNKGIAECPELGSGLTFGVWWFDCAAVCGQDPSAWRENLRALVDQKVRPLLEERLAGRPSEVNRLLAGFAPEAPASP